MIDAALVSAVADFQQVMATTVRVVILAGLAAIAGMVCWIVAAPFRRASLAQKESKAERKRRAEWSRSISTKRNAASSSTELTAKPVGTFAYPDASVRSQHINARRTRQ